MVSYQRFYHRSLARRDNSKGNIIVPCNTNSVYLSMLVAIKGISSYEFIQMSFSYELVTPTHTSIRCFRLAAGAYFCLEIDMPFWKLLLSSICQYVFGRMQFHTKNLSNCALSSHIDPTGD